MYKFTCSNMFTVVCVFCCVCVRNVHLRYYCYLAKEFTLIRNNLCLHATNWIRHRTAADNLIITFRSCYQIPIDWPFFLLLALSLSLPCAQSKPSKLDTIDNNDDDDEKSWSRSYLFYANNLIFRILAIFSSFQNAINVFS